MIESLPQVTVCILDQILYHGLLGSKLLFLEVALRLSIELVSRSSTETEYRGLATVAADILWLQNLLRELHVPVVLPRIYCDNLDVVHLAANPVMHSHTKHF